MKTLIIYSGKHGTTKECAETLAGFLDGQTKLFNLKKEKKYNSEDFKEYDRIILGGSFYVGQIQNEIKEFCQKEKTLLMDKLSGIFVCGMREDSDMENQIKQAFSEEVLQKAKVVDHFGGTFDFKKLGFFEKLIVKKIVGIDKDHTTISRDKIKEFADMVHPIMQSQINNMDPAIK